MIATSYSYFYSKNITTDDGDEAQGGSNRLINQPTRSKEYTFTWSSIMIASLAVAAIVAFQKGCL